MPIPRATVSLMLDTQSSHLTAPSLAALAAAIHSASENRTPAGGDTAWRIAQTRRSCEEWQQQADQHSAADPHPHPQSSHG